MSMVLMYIKIYEIYLPVYRLSSTIPCQFPLGLDRVRGVPTQGPDAALQATSRGLDDALLVRLGRVRVTTTVRESLNHGSCFI